MEETSFLSRIDPLLYERDRQPSFLLEREWTNFNEDKVRCLYPHLCTYSSEEKLEEALWFFADREYVCRVHRRFRYATDGAKEARIEDLIFLRQRAEKLVLQDGYVYSGDTYRIYKVITSWGNYLLYLNTSSYPYARDLKPSKLYKLRRIDHPIPLPQEAADVIVRRIRFKYLRGAWSPYEEGEDED